MGKKSSGLPVAEPNKMGEEELRQWMLLRTRARRYADGKKKASKAACRKNSGGRQRD